MYNWPASGESSRTHSRFTIIILGVEPLYSDPRASSTAISSKELLELLEGDGQSRLRHDKVKSRECLEEYFLGNAFVIVYP